MTDVLSPSTTLTDAINICLSCIGETPVDAPNNTSTNVVLSKQIIEEVSRDVQSKGWWFNTSGANISLYANSGSAASEDFNSSIPEEARRYISIRAARVFQSRFVGSEELQKFSFQEEQVSLAILTQAHVRNGGNATSFTAFPTELKGLGIEEVMFLQQSAEEKLLSLRLKTELKQAEKLASEKELTDAQRSAVQTDTVLKSQQSLTELQTTRKAELENDYIVAPEKAFYDGVVAGTQNTYRDFAAEMRMMGIQESSFQSLPAYKKVELISDAQKLRTSTATETGTDATEITEVNKVMRLIGEAPISALNSNALASECVRLLRDTDKELQGRGWYFNTEEDVELTKGTPASATSFILSGTNTPSGDSGDGTYTQSNPSQWDGPNGHSFIHMGSAWMFADNEDGTPVITATATSTQNPWEVSWTGGLVFSFTNQPTTVASDMLSVEVDDYDTIVKTLDGSKALYDLKAKSFYEFPDPVLAKVIYQRSLTDVPSKYLEYLSVRTAILLTELYPQSGIDIQRLPKMEQELRAYFKDRDFDDANYSVFDNYDAASRIGIHRNYQLT